MPSFAVAVTPHVSKGVIVSRGKSHTIVLVGPQLDDECSAYLMQYQLTGSERARVLVALADYRQVVMQERVCGAYERRWTVP